MILRLKYYIIILIVLLSCEGPFFEIPPEPDTTAPLVEITNPADQGVLSDSVLVTIYASDNDAIKTVQLYINDSLVLDSAEAPYQYFWNTLDYTEDQFHNLRARAVDFANNDNQTSPVRVIVDNNDNIKPTGSLLYPFSGQTLNGVITIIADAADNDSLSSVVFFINGDSVGVKTAAPFSYDWNTSLEFDDYSYVISLKVNDASGNYITLGPISVTVDNEENIQVDTTPPTGTIVYPPMAATVSGTIIIQIDAFDNEEVSKVELTIDGTNPIIDDSSPYEFTWKTNDASEDNNHFIAATATDSSGNTTNLMPVTVFVDNEENIIDDNIPPSVVITSPAANQTVSGSILVTAAAFDNIGISRVEFYRNSTIYESDANYPYEVSWNTLLDDEESSHTWFAKAFDTSNLISQSPSIVVSVDNEDNILPNGFIAQPYAGQQVSGEVEILISAADNVSVSSVAIYINGESVVSISQSPYSYLWNTTVDEVNEDAEYIIFARINDSNDNFYNTQPIAVIVNNDTEFVDIIPPVISILSPISGATVSDSTQIRIYADDNIAIQNVIITIDDTLEFTLVDSPYIALWNTYAYPNGSQHTISSVATDSSNNETTSQSIIVNVDNFYTEIISLINLSQQVGAISLSWDSPLGADTYNIFRDNEFILSTSETSFTDTSITPGTIYCYQISAVNGQNISGPLSDSECGKALLSPPSNFSGSALQDSITLTWSNNEYAGQYRLYRDGSAIYTGTDLTYIDNELEYNNSYSYTISCLDDIGFEGPQTNPIMVSTHIQLFAPELSLAVDSITFELNWSSVFSATSYKVYVNNSFIIETDTTSYSYNGLSGEEKCFRVNAVNEFGTISPNSNQECATPD